MASFTPYLLYADCERMLGWLGEAFGFEEVLRYTGEAGYVNHAEMRIGDAFFYMGDPGDDYRNPRALGGDTAGVYVEIDGSVDELYARARGAGAEILEEPADQEYGHRRFSAKDPEGQMWFFAEPTREVAPEDWGATPAGG
jgi:uncharacterized glyoxalase superfamily protein PhnB